MTLRGAGAVDDYAEPPPFDPVADDPTDAYLEGFASCGIAYLDACSWRHYLDSFEVVAPDARGPGPHRPPA